MENRKITAYVKSVKTEKAMKVGIPLDAAYASKAYMGDQEKYVITDEYTLPPKQKKVVELVKNVAGRYEYAVEIVDMAKENIIEKLIEEIEGLDTIPTIKTNLGGRLEGPQITGKNMELLLLNETKQRLIR